MSFAKAQKLRDDHHVEDAHPHEEGEPESRLHGVVHAKREKRHEVQREEAGNADHELATGIAVERARVERHREQKQHGDGGSEVGLVFGPGRKGEDQRLANGLDQVVSGKQEEGIGGEE